MNLVQKLLKPKEHTLSNGKKSLEPRSLALPITLLVLFVMWWSMDMTGFNLEVLGRRGDQFFVILRNMFPPNFNHVNRVIGPLLDTIKMSLLGTIVGAAFSVPFAIIASTNIVKSKLIVGASRIFLGVLRTIPTLVTALVATFIVGFGATAGTIAIAIFTFSFIGKLLYEQIETVEMGAYEAMEAMGAKKSEAFVVSIFPQIMPRFISNTLFCFEGNVRHAAILGWVGAGGIGLIINEQLAWRNYDNVGMSTVLLFVTVFVIETISRYIRDRLI